MRQLDEVKAQLEQLAKWQASVSDGEATVELYGLEPDEELLAESNQALQSLKADLDRGNWSACSLAPTTRRAP
jgi:hypothetical protein